VLTNYHVMASVLEARAEDVAARATAVACVFDYAQSATGPVRTRVGLDPTNWKIDSSPSTPAERDGGPVTADPTENELDYALLRLAAPLGARPREPKPEPGAPNRGWIFVPPADVWPFKPKMGVVIAQHAAGLPLRLAIDTHAIDDKKNLGPNAARTRVRYATNTLGGSSGSPVFDMEWNLIALHHYGDKDYGHSDYNQGVPIRTIRKRLEDLGKAGDLGPDPK
jgi:hypothetical protein